MIPSRARLVLPGIAWLVVLALVTSNRVTGQVPSATGSIFGEVIDAATGQPVPGALVLLDDARPNFAGPTPVDEHAPMPNGAIPPKRAIASGAGQFVFHDLPKSSYRLQAGAPGYIDGKYGQARASGPGRLVELDDGAHLANANIKLWKYASLSGRVVDEAGEPAVGVIVQAYRVDVEGTRRTLVESGQRMTDDRGVFRIGTLAPSSYVVGVPQTVTTMPAALMDALDIGMLNNESLAAPLMRELDMSGGPHTYYFGLRGVRVGDLEIDMTPARTLPLAPPSTPTAILAYRTVYFPAASTVVDATVLTLAAGQDRAGIDLQLNAVPTVRVAGTVSGPAGPLRALGVHLTAVNARGELDAVDTAVTATNDAGAFTFLGVPGGQYVVRAFREPLQMHVDDGKLPADTPMFARVPLTVADRDIQSLTLILREGARVSGRIVFQGNTAPPAAELRFTQIRLFDQSTSRSSRPAVIASDGTFVTIGSPPGNYSIDALDTPAWTFLSATLGGRDLDDTPLELDAAGVSGVVVTYTNQPTRVNGVVRGTSGNRIAEGDAMIVAFPAGYSAWFEHGMARRYLRILAAGKDGAYSFKGLPPGEYAVAAVPADVIGESQSAAFFEAAARVAARLTLSAGQAASIDLTLRPLR